VFGDLALIQRCQVHKRRNVADHLPAGERERVDARLWGAFADPDPDAGLRKARRLAAELDKTHPDAAGSLREGLEDMFTVRRVGIDGALARTLVCTNMIESMISICRTTSRNVKRWRDDGDMRRRWCAAGLLEAERKFRRLKGHRQMPHLVAALRHHAETVTPNCDTAKDPIAA
jgi:transposase-like protein